jgi:hypothetical protein
MLGIRNIRICRTDIELEESILRAARGNVSLLLHIEGMRGYLVHHDG